mgnify:FL=1
MDYELFIQSNKTAVEYAEVLRNILEKKLHIKITQSKDNDSISIYCTFFTIWIELEDDFGLIMAKEIYDFDANIDTKIQVFGRTYDEGLNLLFRLLKCLLEYNDSLLLEENGSYIVLKKEQKEFTSEVLCDHKPEYPFGILNVEVKKL